MNNYLIYIYRLEWLDTFFLTNFVKFSLRPNAVIIMNNYFLIGIRKIRLKRLPLATEDKYNYITIETSYLVKIFF